MIYVKYERKIEPVWLSWKLQHKLSTNQLIHLMTSHKESIINLQKYFSTHDVNYAANGKGSRPKPDWVVTTIYN